MLNTKPLRSTEVLFKRKNHIITTVGGNVIFIGTCNRTLMDGTQVPSINAAKRESRRLQEIHGHGCLRVQS